MNICKICGDTSKLNNDICESCFKSKLSEKINSINIKCKVCGNENIMENYLCIPCNINSWFVLGRPYS